MTAETPFWKIPRAKLNELERQIRQKTLGLPLLKAWAAANLIATQHLTDHALDNRNEFEHLRTVDRKALKRHLVRLTALRDTLILREPGMAQMVKRKLLDGYRYMEMLEGKPQKARLDLELGKFETFCKGRGLDTERTVGLIFDANKLAEEISKRGGKPPGM